MPRERPLGPIPGEIGWHWEGKGVYYRVVVLASMASVWLNSKRSDAYMQLVANVLIAFVALSHVGFLVLEMFFWDHPVGRRIFGMTAEQSAFSRALAANQGLYNGFLAAGLAWALAFGRFDLKIFFLACVIIAGVYGGLTAKRTILFTQALPAALALLSVWLARHA